MSIKVYQNFTPSGFASNSVSVANMLSDSGLHEQQTSSDEVNENSNVSRLMSQIHNLKMKWVSMEDAIIILKTNVFLLFKIIEILR